MDGLHSIPLDSATLPHRNHLLAMFGLLLLALCGTRVEAQMLQGGVEHSEALPPVDKRLRAGSQFDEQKYFNDVVPNNLWVPIPDWLAGVWETRHETMLEAVDLTGAQMEPFQPRMFKRHDTWTFGMQRDKSGQCWHFINVPSHRRVLSKDGFEDKLEYRHEISKEFLHTGNDSVRARYRFTTITVSPASRQIKRVHQQETLWTFTPAKEGVVRADNTFKVFSENGVPLSLHHNIAPFYKIQEFQPVSYFEGIDMRKSLRDYLISHDMTERVPDGGLPEAQSAPQNVPQHAPQSAPQSSPLRLSR